MLHLLLPALFDLAGSALLNIGLVFVSASATQMLRQSLLLFATVVAVAVYRKPLNKLHCVGLLGCLVGGRGACWFGSVHAFARVGWLVGGRSCTACLVFKGGAAAVDTSLNRLFTPLTHPFDSSIDASNRLAWAW